MPPVRALTVPAAGQGSHAERVLGVALHAPLALVHALCDRLPRPLSGVRRVVENRVKLARFIGEISVRHGRTEIERQMRERREAEDWAEEEDEDEPLESTAGDDQRADTLADSPAVDDAPAADLLPIGDYESLAAIHVVERLASLRDDEIELIRQFESAHRGRRTVLAKIAQLQHARAR